MAERNLDVWAVINKNIDNQIYVPFNLPQETADAMLHDIWALQQAGEKANVLEFSISKGDTKMEIQAIDMLTKIERIGAEVAGARKN